MYRAAALLCLILLVLTSPARAQTEIHRCIGAHGGAVFTDQPCASLQATPVRPEPMQTRPATSFSAPLPTLCAGSTDALRQSVIDAFAARNANRLAGLMLWNGYGRGTVIADIRSLNELMKHPLVDVDIPDADVPIRAAPAAPDLAGIDADPFAAEAPAPMPPPPTGDELVVHTAANDGSGYPQERRFAVVHRAGCLWLRSLN